VSIVSLDFIFVKLYLKEFELSVDPQHFDFQLCWFTFSEYMV